MKKIVSFTCFMILLLTSCRRDLVVPMQGNPDPQQATAARFFNLPATADKEAKLIVANMQSAEARSGFLVEFAKTNGYPVWDKMFGGLAAESIISTSINTPQVNSVQHASGTSTTTGKAGFFMLPLIDTVTHEVTAYMACEKIDDSNYIYRTYNKKKILNTSPLSDTQKINSRTLLTLFAYFEGTINGKTKTKFTGPSISQSFDHVTMKESSRGNTVASKAMMDAKRLFSLACHREILQVQIWNMGDGTEQIVVIMSGCISSSATVTTRWAGGSTGGSAGSGSGGGGYTGPISGNPIAMYPSTGGGGSGSGGGSGGTTPGGGPIGGPGGGPGSPEGLYQDPWDIFWVSATINGSLPALTFLQSSLGITDAELVWLANNPGLADELANYMGGSSPDKSNIAHKHLRTVMNDPEYYDFVTNYTISDPSGGVWWENDTWLSDPANINFDLDDDGDGVWDELNAAEKQLVYKHPISAYYISKNKKEAELRTAISYPGIIPLNNKADAYRHATFAAMNMRSCGFDDAGNMIAKLFGDAHETTTPALLAKEKQMDLFNNDVGYSIGNVMFTILLTDDDITYAVQDKMNFGYLRYLSPLKTPAQDPDYYGANGTQNLNTATHGIYGLTVLTPSDM